MSTFYTNTASIDYLTVTSSAILSGSVTVYGSFGVNSNQSITANQDTTKITGSFTGSFVGNGSGLTSLNSDNLSTPTAQITTLVGSEKFYVINGTASYITYVDFLTELAGDNIEVQDAHSLKVAPIVTGLTSVSATAFTGSLQGTASYSVTAKSSSYALTASYSANVPVTASYSLVALSSSFASTASYWSGTVTSASYAVTASFASSSPAVYDFGSFATPTDVGGGGNFGIVTDGDKGDITVTSSGSIWTIDSGSVTYAKIQNVTTSSVLLGRATTGAGNIEEIILGSGLTISGSTISAAGGGGTGYQIQVDVYTSSDTWTKPAFAKQVRVYVLSGGSGGGSGARRDTTSGRAGGGGGAGNGYASFMIEASGLTSTVAVTVGAGGTGGASVTANDTNGNNGVSGGASSFGGYIASNVPLGGGGGTTSSGAGGLNENTNVGILSSGVFDGRSGQTSTGLSRISSFGALGSTGGGGGAGAAASSTTTASGGEWKPANWAICFPTWTFGTIGTDGGAGGNGANNAFGLLYIGTGGGGGSYKTGQATGAGGNGGYGAGGGGGAASDNGHNSGAGGNGGGGLVIVVSEG